MATEPKIVPYLDMPLQHLDPGVLRRMKRPFHDRNTFEVVERLRAAIPGLTLRTTMIVGFPGETEAEHRNMLEAIGRLRFDRLGAFQYSTEEDTPAGKLGGQLPAKERRRRWHAVMALQGTIALEKNQARVGTRAKVLVEGRDPERGRWIGRSAGEAPEIDGKVFIDRDGGIAPGDFAEVTITRAEPYDLFAQ